MGLEHESRGGRRCGWLGTERYHNLLQRFPLQPVHRHLRPHKHKAQRRAYQPARSWNRRPLRWRGRESHPILHWVPESELLHRSIASLYGPHFIQQDLSAFKTFKFTERWSFTLRTDSRNVFNHTNLGMPNANVDATNVGQITSIAAGGYMRSLQFSGTIRF